MDEVKASPIIHQKGHVAVQTDNIDSLLSMGESTCERAILLANC